MPSNSRWKHIAIGAMPLLLLCVPVVVDDPYFLHVLTLSGVYAILALSLNMLTGYSGLLSLGHQAFFAIGAYMSALLATRLGWPFTACLLAAGAAATTSGYFIARITLRLRGHYFVIATIAFAQIVYLIILNWTELTQGPMGIANIPPPVLLGFVADSPRKSYYFVFALVLLAMFVCKRLVESDVGRALVAMREFENLAIAVGIDTRRYAILTYATSALLAGVAGSYFAHYLRFLSPEASTFPVMVNIVIMMLAGGKGTLIGPVLGAVTFTAVPEVLRFSQEYRLVLYAVAIILLVRFLPSGLWGLVSSLVSFGKEGTIPVGDAAAPHPSTRRARTGIN